MRQDVDSWVELLLRAYDQTPPKAGKIHRLDFTQPFSGILRVNFFQDKGGHVWLSLERSPQWMQAAKYLYREGLFALTGLQRHGHVEYFPYLTGEGVEGLAARFPVSLLSPGLLREVLEFVVQTVEEAATARLEEEPEEDTTLKPESMDSQSSWVRA